MKNKTKINFNPATGFKSERTKVVGERNKATNKLWLPNKGWVTTNMFNKAYPAYVTTQEFHRCLRMVCRHLAKLDGTTYGQSTPKGRAEYRIIAYGILGVKVTGVIG